MAVGGGCPCQPLEVKVGASRLLLRDERAGPRSSVAPELSVYNLAASICYTKDKDRRHSVEPGISGGQDGGHQKRQKPRSSPFTARLLDAWLFADTKDSRAREAPNTCICFPLRV